MRIFDYFDRIRIINLPARTDRRRAMDRELIGAGLARHPGIAYFDAVRPDDAGSFTSIGARGCYESQKILLKQAADAGESILILEDDCFFYPGIEKVSVADGWDIFYGGYTAQTPEDLQRSDIQGSHMMGFTANGAKLVSGYLEKLEPEGVHPPIDAAYVWFRRAYPHVPTLFAMPQMAGQRPSRSDVATLAWYDRVPLIRQGANLLRGLR